MIIKRLFFYVLIGFSFVNCADFKDVFKSDLRASRSQSSSQVQKDKVAVQGATQISEDDIREPIVTKEGTYYFIKEGDSLSRISRKYKINKKYIAEINDLYNSKLYIGRRLFIPHKKTLGMHVKLPTKKKKMNGRDIELARRDYLKKRMSRSRLNFIWPMKSGYISSYYGRRRGRPHDGIDIAAPRGTPIYAAETGRVIYSKRFSGYGNLVVLKHNKEFFSAYAHAHRILVKNGQFVKKGQSIALVGSTGRSTGPHLHFEIRKQAKSIDPIAYLPKKHNLKRLTKR